MDDDHGPGVVPGRAFGPPSRRESEIIETAKETPRGLSEARAAARMFFRFDPGFRSELEGARQYAFSSTEPLDGRSLSEEQRFDLLAGLRNHKRSWEAGYGLATRWGLDVESAVSAIAFDAPAAYPSVSLRREEEPDTGQSYLEIRIYSAYAWPVLRRALRKLAGGSQIPVSSWFEDRPEAYRERVRGMDGAIAARTLALHFLMRSQRGRRASGGSRSWLEATSLWRSVAGDQHSPDELEEPRPWRRRRALLLRGVLARLPDPAKILNTFQSDRGLGQAAWAAELGIGVDDWFRIRTNQPVARTTWERVMDVHPGIADDLSSLIEVGVIMVRTG